MSPTDVKLVGLSGPASGKTFSLTELPASIGRDPANRVVVLDAGMSRRHCSIDLEGCGLTIRDLGSHNGTFVNGKPVGSRVLRHGDEIRLGTSIFLVAIEPGGDEEVSGTLDAAPPFAGSTVVLRPEDAFYLQPAAAADTTRLSARAARDLAALLRIADIVQTVRTLEALQETLLERIVEVVPAESGAIVLCDAPDGPPAPAVAWPDERTQPVPISQTVIRKVLAERVALMCHNPEQDAALGTAASVVASKAHSVLCAPLMLFDEPKGVIYLTTTDAQRRFDEDDLQLVTAVAAMAVHAFENVQHVEWLDSERRRLETSLDVAHTMIGDSAAMQEVYRFVARVAKTDATVLIRGESGTGKELVARAIHRNSRRSDGPFVAINCAALTESLLESELFGHERGAFTGAIAQKRGKLEVAERGTVFLDEIGDLSPALQVKLLRVLQEREFERVGGTRPIKVDIRVVAATNRDLARAIHEGAFRQDLYYRLDVVSIVLPPLRERRDDIPLLVGHFLSKYAEQCKRRIRGLSPEAKASIVRYDWPGNVRELENAIERAVVLGSSDIVLPEDLPDAVVESGVAGGELTAGFHGGVTQAKRSLIVDAMARAEGSYTRAAQLLGLHPNYLHRLVRQLNLKDRLSKR